tara:strand:+ start:201 stop:392 length:192 start_codon:yes stop_codon:yes gene_type:complete
MDMTKYYEQLVGMTITGFTFTDGDGVDDFPTFILMYHGREYKIEVSRDQEGNGGGFLFIGDNK